MSAHRLPSGSTPAAPGNLLGPAAGETERDCPAMAGGAAENAGGRSWRHASGRPSGEDAEADFPVDLRRLAVAVECFHKASLIHDDIEDDDRLRYGEPTLHESHGVPVALNVGDFLLGEGYRLIGQCEVPAENRVAMLQAAAAGQRVLCLGQGAELAWAPFTRPLRSTEVLDIFGKRHRRPSTWHCAWARPMPGSHAEFGR